MTSTARVNGLYRYPVKGLSPEPLARTVLRPGEPIDADRLFAIENGPSGFDPASPAYRPKSRFLMLMRNERLAQLRARFDSTSGILSIEHSGRDVARGDLRTAAGRAALETFFAEFCASDLRGPPRFLTAPGFSFSDVAAKVVSIVNLASVAEIEAAIGAPVHPLRFRGNLYVAGWPPWHEFTLVGRDLSVGPSARLRVQARIMRCAAVNVDPDSGRRDLAIPDALMRRFGHADCGVYAEVIAAGAVSRGDAIGLAPEPAPRLPF
jgi:uncharacterized protein YcbX